MSLLVSTPVAPPVRIRPQSLFSSSRALFARMSPPTSNPFSPPPSQPAMSLTPSCTKAPGRNPATDSRRLSHAVDRLDAVQPQDREAAARYVYDTCIFHVRRALAASSNRPNHLPNQAPHSVYLVFHIVLPFVNRIARRLDRAMRHAEISSEPADASALIVAVDAQGALAALFAVAQNADCCAHQLKQLSIPLRKRSAPALLRTLFSPDMRVTNAAIKALKQISSITCCRTSTWMGSIRAALSLRIAPNISRPILLRNLLSRLADILHEVVRQAAISNSSSNSSAKLIRKRSSRSSFGNIIRQRRTLMSEQRKEQRRVTKSEFRFRRFFWRAHPAFLSPPPTRFSRLPSESDTTDKSKPKRLRYDPSRTKDISDSINELQQLLINPVSPASSAQSSFISVITESLSSANRFYRNGQRVDPPHISTKRDAATVMYIFQRLLSVRITPDLDERIEVISTLSDIGSATFSGQYATAHNIEQSDEYSEAMKHVFYRHGEDIYSMLLSILFRPVRESDAKKMGVFSFREPGISDLAKDLCVGRNRVCRFPFSSSCLPNMDCTPLAAVSCNALLKQFLKYTPEMCSNRMAVLTGTINSAFLHSSEALQRAHDGCSWEISKMVSAVESLTVLACAIPDSREKALELIIPEPVALRLVIETCIRSVSATGRLLAQNAARPSAPKLSDEGTLDSLRSWRALLKIMPPSPKWSGTPSYSSSILFLAQAARRAALVAVMQGYRREKGPNRSVEDRFLDNGAYPGNNISGPSVMRTSPVSFDENNHEGGGTAFSGEAAGFEAKDDNILTTELHQSIIALLHVPDTNPAELFFELYRAVVYLYANDLKKQHFHLEECSPSEFVSGYAKGRSRQGEIAAEDAIPPGRGIREISTQSDEDAKGVLVDNIAVDGQLPSRALRRAVMASELDLGRYFDVGQPPSLQHLSPHQTGLPPGVHTFEEFSHALAIVIGTLANRTITDSFEDPHEAAAMISRDVHRSGSSYMKRAHKRAKSILRRDMLGQDFDWKTLRYEERIRKLEDQVDNLKTILIQGVESGNFGVRKRSLPKIMGMRSSRLESPRPSMQNEEHVCAASQCFCVK